MSGVTREAFCQQLKIIYDFKTADAALSVAPGTGKADDRLVSRR